jgi:hypothetical protein
MSAFNTARNESTAARFHAATAAQATPQNVYKVNNLPTGRQKELKNVNFPVQLGSTDPEDERYALQGKMTNQRGVVPGVGQALVGPEYFDYVTRKMEDAEYTMFQDWMLRQADWSTPEATEYWVTKFPWMLEKRFEEQDRVGDLQKRIARINVAGPQTEDDWHLLWDLDRGVITVPDKPVHLLAEASYTDKNTYQRGMFSPMIQFIPPFDKAGKGKPAHKPNGEVAWTSPADINSWGALPSTSLKAPLTTKDYTPWSSRQGVYGINFGDAAQRGV